MAPPAAGISDPEKHPPFPTQQDDGSRGEERKKHFSLRRIERASRRKNEDVLEVENGNSRFFLTESENLYIIN